MVKDTSADLVLTGEMSHHEILAFTARGQHVILCAATATMRYWLIASGNHSNTERGYLPTLRQRLLAALAGDADGKDAEVIVSEADRDPLEFV